MIGVFVACYPRHFHYHLAFLLQHAVGHIHFQFTDVFEQALFRIYKSALGIG